MPALLTDIRIDDGTWNAASRERRSEWRVALDDIVELHRFDLAVPSLRLLVRAADAGVRLEALDAGSDAPIAAVELPRDRLQPHFDEYLDICQKLGKASGAAASRLEALDIAKRLCHDEAATTIAELLRPLAPDHATCRRLFTLLVALHFDTTRLALPAHRQ